MRSLLYILPVFIFFSCGKENESNKREVISIEETKILELEINEKLAINKKAAQDLAVQYGLDASNLDAQKSLEAIKRAKYSPAELSELLIILQDYIDSGRFIHSKSIFIQARDLEGENPFTFLKEKEKYFSRVCDEALKLYDQIEPYREGLAAKEEIEKKKKEKELKEKNEKLTKEVRSLLASEQTNEFQRKSFQLRVESIMKYKSYFEKNRDKFTALRIEIEEEIKSKNKEVDHLSRNRVVAYVNRTRITELNKEIEEKQKELKRAKDREEETFSLEELSDLALEQIELDKKQFDENKYVPTTIKNIKSVVFGHTEEVFGSEKVRLVTHIFFDDFTYENKLKDRIVALKKGSKGKTLCSYKVLTESSKALELLKNSKANQYFHDRSKLTHITVDEVSIIQAAIRGIENFGCSVIINKY